MYKTLLIILLFCSSCFRETKVNTYTICRNIASDTNLYGMEKNVQGFTDDIFFEIAKNEGFRINFINIGNRSILSALDKKGNDAAIITQPLSPKNEKLYLVSDAFFSVGPVLILRANDTLENFNAQRVKVIGFGRYLGEDLTTREDLGYIFRPYDQIVSAIEELLSARIDAVVMDSIYGHQLESGLYANKIKIATPLFNVTKFRLAVKKQSKNEELIALFNRGLEKLRDEGTYEKILVYWGLYEPAVVRK